MIILSVVLSPWGPSPRLGAAGRSPLSRLPSSVAPLRGALVGSWGSACRGCRRHSLPVSRSPSYDSAAPTPTRFSVSLRDAPFILGFQELFQNTHRCLPFLQSPTWDSVRMSQPAQLLVSGGIASYLITDCSSPGASYCLTVQSPKSESDFSPETSSAAFPLSPRRLLGQPRGSA